MLGPCCRNIAVAARYTLPIPFWERDRGLCTCVSPLPEAFMHTHTCRIAFGGNSVLKAICRTVLLLVPFLCASPLFAAKTWFVRPDGGTRYSANNPHGQCDGKSDTAYPGGSGNQHCAFNDVRWMWWDNVYGKSSWLMVGGDTLVIRGCSANNVQQNPDNPHCRVGGDKATGQDAKDLWCIGTNGCSMPSPPSGTAAQHTRVLGGCAYDGNCSPVTGYPYANNNLAQLFGGFGIGNIVDLSGSNYVELAGLEITTHNGRCARFGGTNPLPPCVRSGTMSDQTDQGIITNAATSHILLRDLYIHGFSSDGITGPIGGPFILERVNISFNAFAGWNFDSKDGKGVSIPNAPGSSVTQSYVTMVGNGCQEEYPITHPRFPARGCWDSSTGGFGDAWSGQDSMMDTFTCDHCNISYNTKDGAMGPHTVIHNIRLTNSTWIGNMGQNGKWGQDANATFLLENNILVGNCYRMSQRLPGASQNFDAGAKLPGSGLSGYCRAAGGLFAYYADAGATVNFNNNTLVTYQPTIFELGCRRVGTCATATHHFTNNLVLGYTPNYTAPPLNSGEAPGLFYVDDKTDVIAGSNNLFYGVRNDGGLCGKNNNLCGVNPLLVNQPAQPRRMSETLLDNLNFHPSGGSPAKGHGKNGVGGQTDFYGRPRPASPSIGAVEPQ